MRITDTRVFHFNDQSKPAKAEITFTFEACLVVKGFKIMTGREGLFLSMPSKKLTKPDKNGKEYMDTAFALTKEFRQYMNEEALRAFHGGSGSDRSQPPAPPMSPAQEADFDMPF